MRNKVLLVSLGLLLLAMPVIAGCAKEVIKEVEVVREQYDIIISGGVVSGEGYMLGYGLAEMLNKEHPWIRATARTSGGSGDDMLEMIKDVEIRPHKIYWTTDPATWACEQGLYGFEEYPYQDLRMIFSGIEWAAAFCTLDPNIKEIKDLEGKRIALLPPGAATNVILHSVLLGAFGPDWKDKVTYTYMGLAEQAGAMRDGLLDAMYWSIAVPGPEVVPWVTSVWLTEIFMKPTAHVINIPKEVLLRGAELGGYPNAASSVPAGRITKDHPAISGLRFMIGFCGDTSMPDEVAYEIAKFAYEHTEGFADYCKTAGFRRDVMGDWALGEEGFHPGAARALKEAGVTIR